MYADSCAPRSVRNFHQRSAASGCAWTCSPTRGVSPLLTRELAPGSSSSHIWPDQVPAEQLAILLVAVQLDEAYRSPSPPAPYRFACKETSPHQSRGPARRLLFSVAEARTWVAVRSREAST